MIAAYCRVSTARQKTDGQVAEISKWLKANGYNENEVQWYIDKESGKTLKRPEFERLQADIFSGQIKTVICWKLDRLSRRLKDGVVLLADWCERGLKIVVITQMIRNYILDARQTVVYNTAMMIKTTSFPLTSADHCCPFREQLSSLLEQPWQETIAALLPQSSDSSLISFSYP